LVDPGIRVVHTWRCYVRIDDGEIELWPPFILIDRTRLSRGPETPEDDELVEIDEKASELETIVNGRPVYHLFAYATDPDRAREPAQERAEQLAGQ
jgi:hypothetical protein